MLPVIVTPIITVALIWSAFALGISLHTLLTKGGIDPEEYQKARTALLTKFALEGGPQMITTRTVRCPKCFKEIWAFYPACPHCGRFMLLDYLFPIGDSKPGTSDQGRNEPRR